MARSARPARRSPSRSRASPPAARSRPGPALTISDPGAGTMYAVTNFPSASPTGSIDLKGTYSTGSLGGTPSSIQAQLSYRRRRACGRRLLMGGALVAVDRRRQLVGLDRQCPARDLLGLGPGRERDLLRDDAQLRHRRLGVRLRRRGHDRRLYGGRSTGALNTTITGVFLRPMRRSAAAPDRDRAGVRQVSATILPGDPGQPVHPESTGQSCPRA